MLAKTDCLSEIIKYGIFDEDGIAGIKDDAPDYVKEAYYELKNYTDELITEYGHC